MRRWGGRILALLALVVVLLLLDLTVIGFPDWVVRELPSRLDMGDLTFEASSMRLDLIRGLVLGDIRWFRKRVVGPPAFETAWMSITIDPVEAIREGVPVYHLRASDGVFRRSMLVASAAAGPTASLRPVKLRAKVDMRRVAMDNVDVEELSCWLDASGTIVRADSIEGRLHGRDDRRGQVSGNLSYDLDANMLVGHLVTVLDPRMLEPAFEAHGLKDAVWLTRRFDFHGDPPRCDVDFKLLCTGEFLFGLRGRVWLEDFAYAGVDALRADGALRIELSGTNRTVEIKPLLVVRPEGIASGDLTVDMGRGLVIFDAMTGMDPKAVLRMVGVADEDDLDLWRFDGPVKATGRGRVDYIGGEDTDFTVTADGVRVGIWSLVAEQCTVSMCMTGTTLNLTGVRGRAYGGDFSGTATFWPPSPGGATNTRYRVDGCVRGASFGAFAEAVARNYSGARQDYQGNLSACLKLEGLMGAGNGRTVTGNGWIAISDGRVFMLPVFGKFSDFMTKVVPGLDFVLRQGDARAEFTIADSKVHSDRVSVEGDVLSLAGGGWYSFSDDLDFDVKMTLMKEHTLVAKLLRVVTYPISKLFEFRVRGSFAEPAWYPVNFSSDLLEHLGLKESDE